MAFLEGLEAVRARSRRSGAGPETPRTAFVYALCQRCVGYCIGTAVKPSNDAGLSGYTFDTKVGLRASLERRRAQKGWSKVKALPKSRR